MTDSGPGGWHVLVTRPSSRAGNLAKMLAEQGATPCLYPVLSIEPSGAGPSIRDALAQASLAVFVSVHAVDAVADAMGGAITNSNSILAPNLQFAAVGAATARALENQGFTAVFQPSHQAGSEGLLESFAEIDPRGMDIVIFAAETGRPLLARYFADRGGRVNQVVCYRRRPNRDLDPANLSHFLEARGRLITITSVECAVALLDLAGPRKRSCLLKCDLVVISERVAAACQDMGFTGTIQVADNASDQGMVDAAVTVARAYGARTGRI